MVCSAGVWFGWMIRDLKAERDQYKAEAARDAAWDAEHLSTREIRKLSITLP